MRYDFIFAGGGLANGLTALLLKGAVPSLRILVVEAGNQLGGEHTWSFHQTDVTKQSLRWLSPLITCSWHGYDVRFPEHNRTIAPHYYSISSGQFHQHLSRVLGDSLRTNTRVQLLEKGSVILDSGERIEGDRIFDGRGWQPEAGTLTAYQKFLGQRIRLKKPHGLTRPVVMDATVEQIDGYRFMYLLPFTKDEILFEDTYYSESSRMDLERYRHAIESYAVTHGCEIDSILYEEQGCLPIPLNGNAPVFPEGIILAGSKAGFYQATTGYSLPDAVRTAELVAANAKLDPESLRSLLQKTAETHWRRNRFFRVLNRMMFLGSAPEKRYRMLQRFYRLPEDLIGRFYAGTLTKWDQARFFMGKPPIPLQGAWNALRKGAVADA